MLLGFLLLLFCSSALPYVATRRRIALRKINHITVSDVITCKFNSLWIMGSVCLLYAAVGVEGGVCVVNTNKKHHLWVMEFFFFIIQLQITDQWVWSVLPCRVLIFITFLGHSDVCDWYSDLNETLVWSFLQSKCNVFADL